MAAIRSKDTEPEMLVRRYLHSCGLRYRLHVREMPGTPDLVFPRYRTVVFVHGCFWHRHEGCQYATMPKTRQEYWQEKFRRNVERDKVAETALHEAGWRVIVVWECDLRPEARDSTLAHLLHDITDT